MLDSVVNLNELETTIRESTTKPTAAHPPIATILTDRGRTHGDYTDHARITQSLKSIMYLEPKYTTLTDCQRESLEMIAHKIGRILAGDPDFRDHWLDIAGYATLIADRCTS